MKTSARRLRLGLAALVACAACATGGPEYGANYDPLEAFPRTGLWVWDDPAIEVPEGDRFTGLELGPALREAVSAQLAERGYREGTTKAHYLVSAQLTVATRMRPEESIAIGSLSLILRKPGSTRPVWVGFARAEIDANVGKQERRARLRAIVAKMLEPFPPGGDR